MQNISPAFTVRREGRGERKVNFCGREIKLNSNFSLAVARNNNDKNSNRWLKLTTKITQKHAGTFWITCGSLKGHSWSIQHIFGGILPAPNQTVEVSLLMFVVNKLCF